MLFVVSYICHCHIHNYSTHHLHVHCNYLHVRMYTIEGTPCKYMYMCTYKHVPCSSNVEVKLNVPVGIRSKLHEEEWRGGITNTNYNYIATSETILHAYQYHVPIHVHQ